jgi:hypothetical protein
MKGGRMLGMLSAWLRLAWVGVGSRRLVPASSPRSFPVLLNREGRDGTYVHGPCVAAFWYVDKAGSEARTEPGKVRPLGEPYVGSALGWRPTRR